jgi:orotate phosphoribosyltransferase
MIEKNDFIRFLMARGALKFGDFTTKSGRRSPYFINMGEFNTGEAIDRLGFYYASHIVGLMREGDIPQEIDNIFGPAYKGIPLCVMTAASLSRGFEMDVPWSFNRKEAKDHGEGGSFVGTKLKDGDNVLILDDVITAGTAVRETLPLLRGAADVNIAGMIIAVDRMERGQGSLSAVDEVREELGIPVFPIITVRDIISYLETAGGAEGKYAAHVKAYLGEFGARTSGTIML